MKKWIPIYGMFTKEANDIPDEGEMGEAINFTMIMWHGFVWGGGLIYLIGYLILKP